MAIELSTAGIKLQYAVESTAGTRPTSGYTEITGIKSIPDLNPEPSSLQTTDLSATEYHTFIPGLKDIGGAIEITANMHDTFQTAWETLVSAAEAAAADEKATWFEVVIPSVTKTFFFSGVPSDLGLSALGVDEVLEIGAFITPTSIHGWDTAST